MPRSSRPAFADTCLMLLLLALALGHGLLATLAMDEKSTTSDEIAHITGGYTFNHWNDYRLHPENGLLPQRWQSLPMVLAGAKYPNQSGQDWATSHVWMLGYVFFYQEGNNLEWMLATARAMNACFGLATVLLVAWWAWHFFAGPGAIVAAVLCVLSPSMLAHSGLATSDMAMTFFLLAAASAWWWHLHDGRRRVWLLSAVSFGLACVAKYTAVLLLPIFTLMMIVRTVSSAPLPFFGRTFPTRLSRLGVMTASLAGQGLVAVLVIWAFCGFRYVAFNPVLPPGDFIVSWDHVLSIGSAQAAVIKLFRNWHLLPEGFLYGFAYTLKSVEARGAFLDGTYSLTGWVSFFPKAFLYKTAPSLLVALAVAAGLVLLRMRAAGLGWLRPPPLPRHPPARPVRGLLGIFADKPAQHWPPPHPANVSGALHLLRNLGLGGGAGVAPIPSGRGGIVRRRGGLARLAGRDSRGHSSALSRIFQSPRRRIDTRLQASRGQFAGLGPGPAGLEALA